MSESGGGASTHGAGFAEEGLSCHLPPVSFSTGLSEQELRHASLPRLPYCKGPDLRDPEREVSTEDPSTNYTCIAENKPA